MVANALDLVPSADSHERIFRCLYLETLLAIVTFLEQVCHMSHPQGQAAGKLAGAASVRSMFVQSCLLLFSHAFFQKKKKKLQRGIICHLKRCPIFGSVNPSLYVSFLTGWRIVRTR